MLKLSCTNWDLSWGMNNIMLEFWAAVWQIPSLVRVSFYLTNRKLNCVIIHFMFSRTIWIGQMKNDRWVGKITRKQSEKYRRICNSFLAFWLFVFYKAWDNHDNDISLHFTCIMFGLALFILQWTRKLLTISKSVCDTIAVMFATNGHQSWDERLRMNGEAHIELCSGNLTTKRPPHLPWTARATIPVLSTSLAKAIVSSIFRDREKATQRESK